MNKKAKNDLQDKIFMTEEELKQEEFKIKDEEEAEKIIK